MPVSPLNLIYAVKAVEVTVNLPFDKINCILASHDAIVEVVTA